MITEEEERRISAATAISASAATFRRPVVRQPSISVVALSHTLISRRRQ
jgi:hypothetical protein